MSRARGVMRSLPERICAERAITAYPHHGYLRRQQSTPVGTYPPGVLQFGGAAYLLRCSRARRSVRILSLSACVGR